MHQLFNFVGKINCCTQFLIIMLKNNTQVLFKLLSNLYINNLFIEKSNQLADDPIHKLIQSIFKIPRNNLIENNKESIKLFFELLMVMTVTNNEPVIPFYEDVLLPFNIM